MSTVLRHRDSEYFQPRVAHLFGLVAALLLAVFIIMMLAVETVR